MIRRVGFAVLALSMGLTVQIPSHAAPPRSTGLPVATAPRDATPVIVTGKQLAALSAPAPIPLRVLSTDFEHPGTTPSYVPIQRPPMDQPDDLMVTPPDSSVGGANVPTDSLAVFRYTDSGFVEIPSQVDERFWRFLANPGGENGEYSGFDAEFSYVFDGEGYRKTAGDCYAAYAPGPITTPDPVAGFDDDDEVTFMARDAGSVAPAGATPVNGKTPYEVTISDPVTGASSYVYVVSATGRAHTFSPATGYVHYERDAYSDRYINARSGEGIPSGIRCAGADPASTSTPGSSTGPRRPRDTATLTSDRYSLHFTGRWTVDGLSIGDGVDLLDQWKGRAFQLAKKQAVSVGFIGDQAWEESSVTLGERAGPIRVIRESWGAKSGTNVSRVYMLYDRVWFDHIYCRVHPIPPDGIYSIWNHNLGAVSRYYTAVRPDGVPIDGQSDESIGNVDIPDVKVGNAPTIPSESHYDVTDPTLQPVNPVENWEEVAGPHGSIVYYLHEPHPGAGVITSYYRDDASFNDGDGNPASIGAHGLHIEVTGDTDNLPTAEPLDEIEVLQAQYLLPGDPRNVGENYASTERFPLNVSTSLR